MLGGLDIFTVLFIVSVGGMAVQSVHAWWSGEPRGTVLYSVFFCLSFFFVFISTHGTEILGFSKQAKAVAVGLEFVFMLGAVYFMWKQHFGGGTTKDTA